MTKSPRQHAFIGLLTALMAISPLNVLPTSAMGGDNAVRVIGQYDSDSRSTITPVYDKGGQNNSPDWYGLYNPQATEIDLTNHRLFVADTSNSRVLVFNLNTDNTLVDELADYVLGQPDFSTNSYGTTQAKMKYPHGMAFDSTNNRLFVVDRNNNRVLVYDTSTITNGENAAYVLGQTDFITGTYTAAQNRMYNPMYVEYDASNDRLFVSEGFVNHRILVFDVATIANGENATNVLGQSDFVTTGAATAQNRFYYPSEMAYDGSNSRLFVVDDENNRVLVFDVATLADGENAVNVIGQTDYTSNTAATTQAGLNSPYGIEYDSTNNLLYVSQNGAHRISVFDVATIANGETAANVLGQADFTSGDYATTQAGLQYPAGLMLDPSRNMLYVADSNNNRVMIFDVATVTNGEGASSLMGQYTYSAIGSVTPNYTKVGTNGSPNKFGFYRLTGTLIDETNDRLYVVDTFNNRVLVFNLNSSHGFDDYAADYVLGQTDFDSNTSGVTASTMSRPRAVTLDVSGNRLFVSDSSNNRVLVFDVSSITNGESAIAVLGQSDFTSNASVTTQAGMKRPENLAYDSSGSRLFVADPSNARVLVYDVATIANGENAANVLGQPDFTTSSQAVTQAKLSQPIGVAYDSTRGYLFVGESEAVARIMVYDVNSITDGENAINVIGQADFTSSASGTTQSVFQGADTLAYEASSKRLFVSDASSYRILKFDTTTITNGMNASAVYGQANYTESYDFLARNSTGDVYGLTLDSTNGYLYAADYTHHRVIAFDVGLVAAASNSSGGSSHVCNNPSVGLHSPNGGETYSAGGSNYMFWGADGCNINGVKISLSTDGGENYTETIVENAYAESGAYQWTVPDVSTEQAKIKIDLLGAGGAVLDSDESDSPFTIIGTEPASTGGDNTGAEPDGDAGTGDEDTGDTGPGNGAVGSIGDDKDLASEDSEAALFCQAHPLIKLPNDNDPRTRQDEAVYYCGQDGHRYAFPNFRVYMSWYDDFTGVEEVTEEQMSMIPLGGNVTYRPGVRMIKITTDPKVYEVSRGGILRWVMSENLAEKYYGPKWNQMIDDVSDAYFANYQIGDPLAE